MYGFLVPKRKTKLYFVIYTLFFSRKLTNKVYRIVGDGVFFASRIQNFLSNIEGNKSFRSAYQTLVLNTNDSL